MLDVCSVYSYFTTNAPNNTNDYNDVFLAPLLVHERSLLLSFRVCKPVTRNGLNNLP